MREGMEPAIVLSACFEATSHSEQHIQPRVGNRVADSWRMEPRTRSGTCKKSSRRPQQGRPLGKVVAFVLALSELAPDHDKATHYSVDLTYKRRLHAREKMEPAMDADRKMWWPKQPENLPLERGVEPGIDLDGEPLVCSR